MRQSRVLVLAGLDTGGAERTAVTLANAWHRLAHPVTIVTLESNPTFFNLDPDIRRMGLDIVWKTDRPWRNLATQCRAISRLRAVLKSLSPDVVISFVNQTNIRTLIATAGLGLPVVVSERTDPKARTLSLPWRLLRRLTYPAAAAHIFQSRYAARHFDYLPGTRQWIIPNPVVAPPATEPPDMPTPKDFITAIGRLVPAKGFDVLIDAFGQIAVNHPQWHLMIAGEGPERPALEDRVHRLKLGGRVLLPGTTRRPGSLLAAAAVVAQPSRWEGFPNALAEAMSLGRPVIATDIPGATGDIVTHTVSGWIVPPNDATALAEALTRLIQSSELRHRLGAAARQSVAHCALPPVLSQWDLALATATHPS